MKRHIEEEYGELLSGMPDEYDPREWGWDITSLAKGNRNYYTTNLYVVQFC
jgi:hypothetical protein